MEENIKVLEVYDMLEKLLIDKDEQPIVINNKTISDAILYALNDLYKKGLEEGKTMR